MPQYACRGIRESFYRARLGNCHGPVSRQAYLGGINPLKRYGGNQGEAVDSSGYVASGWGKGFYSYTDTEKLCGEADMTGLDTKGGVAIYAFFRNMFAHKEDAKFHAAYIHTNHVKIVSTSASGIEVEE